MSFRGLACTAALVLAAAAGQAEAAWNNAFQVCCFGCRNRASSYYYPRTPIIARSAPIIAYSAPPVVAYSAPADACCHTSYVQRCYYQPVTTYKTEMVPVTSNYTSYFWEPVCSYRSSCYVDPCTGASVQVTQPVTSYRLRSQCNSVTSYVARCVPVTSYRIAYRLEPVTNCPPPCPPAGGLVPAGPGVTEGQALPNPAQADPGNRLPPANVPMQPNVDESQYFPGQPNSRPRSVRPDRIVSRSSPTGASVRGQVVANNYVSPMRGARVLFVSQTNTASKIDATADAAGQFAVNLPAGGWKIYLSRRDGTMEFHSNIDIQQNRDRQVMVVSR